MNDIDEKSRVTPTVLDRALELAADVEAFNLYKCSIGDDLEKHWGYIYAFLDTVRPFAAAVKRIGDPDLSEQISGLNLDDVNYIYEAYTLKASLQGIIDHLREVSADPTYGASVNANVAFLEPSVLAALCNAKSQQFDYAKLIRLCEELNDAYGRANYLSCALLIHAVMNHVPPVFGCQTFAQGR